MKYFIAIPAFFLAFFACDHDWDYAVITNQSGYPVEFKFKGVNGKETLAPGQSKRFDSYWTTALDYYTPDKRVVYSYDSDYDNIHGTFRNRPSWKIRVNNTLSFPVTLTAEGWMDDMEDIPQGDADNSKHTGVIFTREPSFSVWYDDKIITTAAAEYQPLTVDDNTMYVTIRWK
jgi:hypothetical protein